MLTTQEVIMTTSVDAYSVQTSVPFGALPFFQPIVNLADSSVSFESLGRLRHEGVVLNPAQFLPHLEGTPALEQFDRAILAKSVAQIAEWKMRLKVHAHVHVNASSDALRSTSYAQYVHRLLTRSKVDPSQLTIEVIETCSFWKDEQILKTLAVLQAIGVKVAIDDFPAWSDPRGLLEWLTAQPRGVDYLKIDRSLVRKVCDLRQDGGLAFREIREYVSVAKSLGIHTIAEGVEKVVDSEIMQFCGVDALQGYGIGKPVPAHLAEQHFNISSTQQCALPMGITEKGRQSIASW